MTKAVKKAIELNVFQLTEEAMTGGVEWPQWMADAWHEPAQLLGSIYISPEYKGGLTDNYIKSFRICTLEGDLAITPGDWIVQGVEGEIYPVKDKIFKKTYDLVEKKKGKKKVK